MTEEQAKRIGVLLAEVYDIVDSDNRLKCSLVSKFAYELGDHLRDFDPDLVDYLVKTFMKCEAVEQN